MIAIVGAGISGLTLAHELSRRSVEHIVLEQDTRPGGVIRSALVDGHLLEWGPQRTRLVGAMRSLIQDLDLTSRVILAPPALPLFVYRKGGLRTVPMSFGDFASSDLISLCGKLRVMLEPFTSAARLDESVESFFVRKAGREVYANMLGPLYGGLYASDPADMVVGLSLVHALREMGVSRSMLLRAMRRRGGPLPVACSFVDGMETLPAALYERHASNVRLGRAVGAVRQDGSRFVLEISDVNAGASDIVRAEHVVFTGSARATSSLLARVAPDAAQLVKTLRYNPLAVVHLYSTSAVPRGLGYQVGFDEPLHTRGVTFNDAMFARHGVYTSYLGGARHPEVLDWSDQEIARVAVEEFATVTGADSSVISVARTAMPAWDRTWSALAALRVPDGVHFCTNWESRPGLPGRIARARALAAQLTQPVQ